MNRTPDSKELQSIVDEVFRRVADRLAIGGGPPSRSPCALPHGMAAAGPVDGRTRQGGTAGGVGQLGPVGPVLASDSPVASAFVPGPETLVEAGACRIGSAKAENGAPPDPSVCARLAPYLDHTILKPEATDDQIRQLCEEARRHRFATVCVNSAYVPLCASLLGGSGVRVCTVVGFPLGAMATESKAFETRHAIAQGADEIDMVVNVGKLQQGDYGYVLRDIEAVVRAAHGVAVKVILETALLTDEQKIIGCALSKAAGAQFVKTSTGFAKGGATTGDIALMRRIVGPDLGVKASGGIRDCETARRMVEAGANRIGASASVAIVAGR